MTHNARPPADLAPRQQRFVEEYLLGRERQAGCDPSRLLAQNRRSARLAAFGDTQLTGDGASGFLRVRRPERR